MSARESALRVLTACRVNGAWADVALDAELDRAALSDADAALCSRLVYGVLQNRILLDYCVSACCTQRMDHLQQPLPDILRIGAYQILFLNKIPDRAAVNEAVKLAKANKRGAAAGLVNAVLRRLAADRQIPPMPPGAAERLSIETSHPLWLTERVISILGLDEAERFLRCNNEIAPVCVQRNPMKVSVEALLTELRQEGIETRPHPWVPDCLELRGAGDLSTLPAFFRGSFIVQDAAARMVSLCAGVEPEQKVLDVCAAPGGKTFSAAFAMGDRGSVVACDLHENKLKRIRDGAKRLGLACIETQAADAREFRPAWEGAFDTVLCDVPCSGLGIIRKKPDVRYKDPGALSELPAIQSAILENASRYVKPGGVLVYSTCTILPEENEEVTGQFLDAHKDFEPLAHPMLPSNTLWPQRDDTDGFYIKGMRRVGEWTH